jgi:hypothetical protein
VHAPSRQTGVGLGQLGMGFGVMRMQSAFSHVLHVVAFTSVRFARTDGTAALGTDARPQP